MAVQDPRSGVCVTCGQSATTHCAGCADIDVNGACTLTLYCGKACQHKDWTEAFDLDITKVERDQDGKLHIFDKPVTSPSNLERVGVWGEGDDDTKRTVLSFGAGGSVFASELYDLGVKAFKRYVAKAEESDVRVFDSRLLLRGHAEGTTTAASQSIHHVVCVTLKDDSVWVVDPAGAQHGQPKAVLPFSEYDRDFVAKAVARHPYGSRVKEIHRVQSIQDRHMPTTCIEITASLNRTLELVESELAEWEIKLVTVETMVRATNNEYQRLKSMLLDHLSAAACDSVKYWNKEQKSPGQPIIIQTVDKSTPEVERQRIERKRARRWATVNPILRQQMEEAEAKGTKVVVYRSHLQWQMSSVIECPSSNRVEIKALQGNP